MTVMARFLHGFVDGWFAQFSESPRAWAISLVLVLLTGIIWAFLGRSKGKPPICPPELLKDDLAIPKDDNGVANVYTLDREMSVPFDIGDVRVSKILVHPIKSCRGISVQSWKYTLEGLEHDRKWCIIEQESHLIITARSVAKMVLITPTIEYDPTSHHGGRLLVSFPEDSGCETFSVPLNLTEDLLKTWPAIEECSLFNTYFMQGYICSALDGGRSPSEILSQYFEQPVYLVMKGPRVRECSATLAYPDLKASTMFQDGYPFLVASEESLQEVGRVIRAFAIHEAPELKIGQLDRERWRDGDVTMERFRPNIVLKGSGVPFAEDMWRQIMIISSGDSDKNISTFSLVSKCTRCLLPNVDPGTGIRDAAVPYKVLLKFRQNRDPARMAKPCFGCNAVVNGDGIVNVGNSVEVKEWATGIGV